MGKLKDKVAVVTGGSKGIGEAIIRCFAAEGAVVVNLDVDARLGQLLQNNLVDSGVQTHYISCDLGDTAQVEQAFASINAKFGRLDILVNNAGIAHIGNVESTTPEDMDRLYRVNIKGVYHCLHFGVPLMKASGGGAIVNISSVAAVTGFADRFAYSMSKGAVQTMTFSIAKDYIADQIRCNAIGPARVHTPFVDGYLAQHYPGKEKEMFDQLSATQPIGRMGKPEEVAALALFLCSEDARFITGAFYPVDGGFLTLNTG